MSRSNVYFKLTFIVTPKTLWQVLDLILILQSSYDNDGTTRDEIKERFCLTMDFVENYLREVVSQNVPFSDKEKNKLTFEVNLCGWWCCDHMSPTCFS